MALIRQSGNFPVLNFFICVQPLVFYLISSNSPNKVFCKYLYFFEARMRELILLVNTVIAILTKLHYYIICKWRIRFQGLSIYNVIIILTITALPWFCMSVPKHSLFSGEPRESSIGLQTGTFVQTGVMFCLSLLKLDKCSGIDINSMLSAALYTIYINS